MNISRECLPIRSLVSEYHKCYFQAEWMLQTNFPWHFDHKHFYHEKKQKLIFDYEKKIEILFKKMFLKCSRFFRLFQKFRTNFAWNCFQYFSRFSDFQKNRDFSNISKMLRFCFWDVSNFRKFRDFHIFK